MFMFESSQFPVMQEGLAQKPVKLIRLSTCSIERQIERTWIRRINSKAAVKAFVSILKQA